MDLITYNSALIRNKFPTVSISIFNAIKDLCCFVAQVYFNGSQNLFHTT
jgi:hypothetical protein